MKVFFSKHISWQRLNNTVYIIDEITKKRFLLTGVAEDIWLLIKEDYPFIDIVNTLSKKYNVSEDVLVADTNVFIENLYNENLLTKGDR